MLRTGHFARSVFHIMHTTRPQPGARPNDEERGQPHVPVSVARSSSSVSFPLDHNMTLSRKHVIRQGIARLTKDLQHLNAECDRLLRSSKSLDSKTGDVAALVRGGMRTCALSHAIRRLEYRLAVARELLIYDMEHRFQFRRRLHVQENGGRNRYHFWKI